MDFNEGAFHSEINSNSTPWTWFIYREFSSSDLHACEFLSIWMELEFQLGKIWNNNLINFAYLHFRTVDSMLMCAACKEKEREREKYERMKKLTKHKLEGKSIKVRKKFNRPHKVIRRLNSNPLSGSYMQFYSLSLPLTLSLSLSVWQHF